MCRALGIAGVAGAAVAAEFGLAYVLLVVIGIDASRLLDIE